MSLCVSDTSLAEVVTHVKPDLPTIGVVVAHRVIRPGGIIMLVGVEQVVDGQANAGLVIDLITRAGVEGGPGRQAPVAGAIGHAAVPDAGQGGGKALVIPGQAGVDLAAPVVVVGAAAQVLGLRLIRFLEVVGQHQAVADHRAERAVLACAPADIALEVQAAGAFAGGVDGIDIHLLQLVRIDRRVAGITLHTRQHIGAGGGVEQAIAALVFLLQQAVDVNGGQQVLDLHAPEVSRHVELMRGRPDNPISPGFTALRLKVRRAALGVVNAPAITGAFKAFAATVVVDLVRFVAFAVGLIEVIKVRRAKAGAVTAAKQQAGDRPPFEPQVVGFLLLRAATECVLVPTPGRRGQQRVGERNAELAAGGITVTRAAGIGRRRGVVEGAVIELVIDMHAVGLTPDLGHAGKPHRPGRQVEQVTVDVGAEGLGHRLALLHQVAAKLPPLRFSQGLVQPRRVRGKYRVAVLGAQLRPQVVIADAAQRCVAGVAVAGVLGAVGGDLVTPVAVGELVFQAQGAGPGQLAPFAVVGGLAADFLTGEVTRPALQVAGVLVDEVRRGKARAARVVLGVIKAKHQVGKYFAAVAEMPGATGVAVVVLLLRLEGRVIVVVLVGGAAVAGIAQLAVVDTAIGGAAGPQVGAAVEVAPVADVDRRAVGHEATLVAPDRLAVGQFKAEHTVEIAPTVAAADLQPLVVAAAALGVTAAQVNVYAADFVLEDDVHHPGSGASEPYTADAPLLRISMRSIITAGIFARLVKLTAPSYAVG